MSEPTPLFGPRCRTMASQRPCGMRDCVRSDCKRPTEPVKAPTTGVQLTRVSEPTYTLTGLTAAHIERLQDAMSMVSEMDRVGMELQNVLYEVHRS